MNKLASIKERCYSRNIFQRIHFQLQEYKSTWLQACHRFVCHILLLLFYAVLHPSCRNIINLVNTLKRTDVWPLPFAGFSNAQHSWTKRALSEEFWFDGIPPSAERPGHTHLSGFGEVHLGSCSEYDRYNLFVLSQWSPNWKSPRLMSPLLRTIFEFWMS